MRRKNIGVIGFVIIGAMGTALIAHMRPHKAPVLSAFVLPAQAADNRIHIDGVPTGGDTISSDWNISRYLITLPPHKDPLDLHMVTLIDDKGMEDFVQRSDAWPQPLPITFRMDTQTDADVKAILAAQKLPVKEQLVTYHIEMGLEGGSVGQYETVAYRHAGGSGQNFGQMTDNATIGQKIVLSDEVRMDKTQRFIPNWQQRGILEKLPAGMAHRFTTYILFTPRTGPIRGKGRIVSINQDVTRY